MDTYNYINTKTEPCSLAAWVRGHIQTDLHILNVKMAFRGDGVIHVMLSEIYAQTMVKIVTLRRGEGGGFNLTSK